MSFRSRWAQTTQWTLTRFTRLPTWGRPRSALIIAGIVAVIGVADYLTDVSISLFIFYLVPVLLAAAWLGGSAAVLTAAISVVVRIVGDMINVYPAKLPLSIWWSVGSAFFTFLCVVWILTALIELHRELERRVVERTAALQASVDERRQLEHDLLVMGARERNAMGRELHEDLLQHFVATALAAEVLVQRLGESLDPRTGDAKSIVRWLEEGITKTRRLARGLMVAEISPERLGAELTELAATYSGRAVQCHFRQDGLLLEIDPAACAQIFQIAHDAIGNALRYGAASRVDITLSTDESATCLTVEDNGRGFNLAETGFDGMGLRIMKNRAEFIGGSLRVLSSPGEGARVVCHLPVVAPVAL